MSLDQLFLSRPTSLYSSYETPIKGLYLCGSSTHPGKLDFENIVVDLPICVTIFSSFCYYDHNEFPPKLKMDSILPRSYEIECIFHFEVNVLVSTVLPSVVFLQNLSFYRWWSYGSQRSLSCLNSFR